VRSLSQPSRTRERKRWAVRATIFAGVAMLVGCAADKQGDPASTTGTTTSPNDSIGAAAGDELVPSGGSAPALETVTASQFEQVLQSYTACLSEQLVGTIRYNLERYMGLSTDLGLPDGRRSDVISQHAGDCMARTSLDAFAATFESENPVGAEEIGAIANELDACLGPLAASIDFASLADTSMSDIEARYSEAIAAVQPPDNVTLIDCYETVVLGPAIAVGAE